MPSTPINPMNDKNAKDICGVDDEGVE